MKLVIGPPPKWKSKLKPSALDKDLEFMKMLRHILSGKMGVKEQIGMIFTASDAKRLSLKHPGRTARDVLRRTLRSTGLEADYTITLRLTDTDDWALWVTYDPPNVASTQRRQDLAQMTRPA